MQAFYARLSVGGGSGYWAWLARLTQLTLEQAASVRSDLSWDVWQTGPA